MRVGVDIVEVGRIRALLGRHRARFLKRVFTEEELQALSSRKRIDESLAGRFAAKEAFMKALGRRCGWREIEVLATGPVPFIRFLGRRIEAVSISHEREYAVAVVSLESSTEL